MQQIREEKCFLCGGNSFKKLFDVGENSIVSCRKCGLTKTKDFFQPDYKRYHRDEEYQNSEWLFKNFFLKKIKQIEEFLPKPGRILEIGCSTGTLLKRLKSKGWEVWGVEPSESAEVARKKGIRVIKKYFERAKLANGYFDAIVLNHTLEHLENPISILKKAKTLLKKGGILLVDVPNFGSLSARLFGRYWGYLAPGEHLWHFTPETLKKVFKKAGFRLIRQETASGIFVYGSPLGGLIDKLTHARKSFFTDLGGAPFAYISTKTGLGTNLITI